ncbi:MAG: LPS assembly protein LptD [Desulfonauticus sp.]|nr:LPS assembly protein LptD [Desulfonauticus sp.]
MLLNKKIFNFIIFWSIVVFSSFAQAKNNSLWHLEANKVIAQNSTKIIEALGNVYLYKGQNYLQADYIRYYIDTNWVYLKGNVKIKWQEDILEGKEAEFDLKNKVGWVKNGTIFIPTPHIYVKAKYMEKKGPNTYKFKEATFTSCDGKTPAWSLKTKSGQITLKGYATLWNTKFLIKNVPVLYTPILIVPAKNKRQSGLLFPQLGYSSLNGFNYNQPYFQIINQEQDLTIYENYYSKRGLMHGLEYRFTPNLATKGLLRLDYLHDLKTAPFQSEEPSFLQTDDLIRPNADRFWLRGKVNSFLFYPEWQTKLDLDYVSDQNYLREFKTGYSGFNQSRKEFLQQFGRDIQEADSLTRVNSLQILRSFDKYLFDAKLVYTENLAYKNHNLPAAKDPTIQRLPELNLNIYKTKLPYLPLDLQTNVQSVYFWRQYGTRAERLDIYPILSKTFKYPYLTIIPKFGYRETFYLIDKYQNENPLTDTKHKYLQRNIYNFSISSYSELYKIYDLQKQNYNLKDKKFHFTKLKHIIKPEIIYNFQPDKDQRELPYFDSLDRISPKEEITYDINNLFILRKDYLNSNGTLKKEYFNFVRLKFEQSYDFREARRNNDLKKYKRRPFSDLLTQAQINITPYLSFSSKTYYSFYLKKLTEQEQILNLTWPDKLTSFISLDTQEPIDEFKRHRSNRTKILKLGGSILFIPHWRLSLLARYDLEKHKDLEKSLTLTYLHQCFSLSFLFSKTDYEQRYQVVVNLLNLGSIGK